jgi:hypothetical protein
MGVDIDPALAADVKAIAADCRKTKNKPKACNTFAKLATTVAKLRPIATRACSMRFFESSCMRL